jgi:hypothetical protein
VNENDIIKCLQRYGDALSAGDLTGISTCWDVPGLVLADDGAVALSDGRQLRAFFAKVIEWYRSRGLMATRPVVEEVVPLTERMILVGVRWPSFDEAGIERYSERSQYILRLGGDGQIRIRVGITEPLSHPD